MRFKILFLVTTLLTAFQSIAQINVDQVVRVGRNALYFDDYVLSIRYFNQAIDVKPWLAYPYFYRAIAKYNLDDFSGAEADATLAIERNPFITDAYELRGVARQNLGNTAAAITDYHRVLFDRPKSNGVLLNLAIAYQEAHQPDSAAETFNRMLTMSPGYANGHIAYAQFQVEHKDTVGARESVERAIALNRFNTRALAFRSALRMNSQSPDSIALALADIDEAIRLEPSQPGLYINRAFVRYKLDDYFGAMADYDYALELEPHNMMATYNRALLRMEVADYDKALADLNSVLAYNSNDYKALFNRAIVQKNRSDFKSALADANAVVNAFPDLAAAYFLRFDVRQAAGDRNAKEDYDKSLALANSKVGTYSADSQGETVANDTNPSRLLEIDNPEGEDQEVVAARFTTLLTTSPAGNSTERAQAGDISGKSIRGRVQDTWDSSVGLEPMFTASYYTSPTELKPSSDYLKEVDEVNLTGALPMLLQVTNRATPLTDQEDINRHFASINYITELVQKPKPRSIDYFARGMEYFTLRDYAKAVADFNEASNITPQFTLALFMKGVALEQQAQASIADENSETPSIHVSLLPDMRTQLLKESVEAFDKALELKPAMAPAYYNKGVALAETGDYTSAINALTKAIGLKPEMGEAYFNRGYCYLRLGNIKSGNRDLSRAGELGVVEAYSVLKRMNR